MEQRQRIRLLILAIIIILVIFFILYQSDIMMDELDHRMPLIGCGKALSPSELNSSSSLSSMQKNYTL